MKNFIKIVKFTFFSISAGVIQFVVTTLMNSVFKIDYQISYLTGLVLSVLWNFTFNRKFTFKSANNVPIAMMLALLFYVPFTPASYYWTDALVNAHVPEMLVTVITMLVNFVLEFLWQQFVVFRKSEGSAVNVEEEKFKKIIKICKDKRF